MLLWYHIYHLVSIKPVNRRLHTKSNWILLSFVHSFIVYLTWKEEELDNEFSILWKFENRWKTEKREIEFCREVIRFWNEWNNINCIDARMMCQYEKKPDKVPLTFDDVKTFGVLSFKVFYVTFTRFPPIIEYEMSFQICFTTNLISTLYKARNSWYGSYPCRANRTGPHRFKYKQGE